MHYVVSIFTRLFIHLMLFKDDVGYFIRAPYRKYHLKKLALRCVAGDSVIFFFPDYSKHNPHQKLLGDAMPAGFCYVSGSIADALYFQRCVGKGVCTYFHLHWPDPLLYRFRFSRFINRLDTFQSLGGRCIWSVHNVLPREVASPTVMRMQKQLAAAVDAIHVFTLSSVRIVAEHYGVQQEKCLVAMRGNYISFYENNRSLKECRKKLNIADDRKVLCFFGQLRPYKGIGRLLDCFAVQARSDDALSLIIAGHYPPRARSLMAPVMRRARQLPHVHIFPEFITGSDVQNILNASDVLVLPYTDIINSGTYILGLSFGCCMVAPHMGSIADIATHHVDTITYAPEDPDGLERAVAYALSLSSEERDAIGKNAYQRAKGLSWNETAALLCQRFAALHHK